MTKEEFIRMYLANSGLPLSAVTDYGYVIDGHKEFAVPCHCDYEECKGWIMEGESR